MSVKSVLVGFFILFSAFALADEKLDLLKNISNAGAPFLTLKMIDQAQPKYDADLYNWILWEQERYAILEKWQQWNDLLIRLESLPKDLPEPFQYQVVTKQAKAYVALGQNQTARKILLPYLWNASASESKEYIAWRKVIVDSYIADHRLDDARIAMRRFQQDFDQQDVTWLENQVLVLIQSQHYDEAKELLESQKEDDLNALSLYVDLLSKTKTAKSVWKESVSKAKKADQGTKQSVLFWQVALKAAEFMSPVDRVIAHEQIFKTPFYKINDILKDTPLALWQSYLEYAEFVGNRAELLQGDDESWLKLAKNAIKITPVKARSLLAHIMQNSSDKHFIEQASQAFLSTLKLDKEEDQLLLSHTFSKQGHFTQVAMIPFSVRFELVDLALKSANITQATRLMSGLETHPQNTDLFAWQLRRARVLILGGQLSEGQQVLTQLLSNYTDINVQKTDRILQVLFDLQTIEAHEDAIGDFNRLLTKAISPKQKREILFWMADSYKALKQHHKAALLYLQSALLIGPTAMDPWAQTAKYSAAESLEKAGLIDDARRIFKSLLQVAKAPARRATLRHKIQQLWLNQNL